MEAPKQSTPCVVRELAAVLSRDDRLRAVSLDPRRRELSFACLPGFDAAAAQVELERLIQNMNPDRLPGCVTGNKLEPCSACGVSAQAHLPPGIRLVALPGSGFLLQKDSCETAPRFWRWRQFQWAQVKTAVAGEPHHHSWEWPLAMAAVCGISTLVGFVLQKHLGEHAWPAMAAYLAAYIAGVWFTVEETWELLRKRVLDIHFLMLCVAAGAAVIGHFWEGAALLFLFSLSGALEHFAQHRTEREINSLFKAAPKQATLLDSAGEERLVPVEELQIGARLLVRPGEQFSVDAEVMRGASAADESNLTGESIPVDKTAGDLVMAGTLNLWGKLECRVMRPAAESSLSAIIRLIREAQESKAPSQRFTDKFGSAYTYAILVGSLCMFFVWWRLFNLQPAAAFYRTMTLLVVASPCALVLSIPSAILAGIAAGARRGILFRGGAAIEKLAEVRRVALDKTGTLTTGHLKVVGIECEPPGRESLMMGRAAALAHSSTHPVSQAVWRAALDRGLRLPATRDFRSHTGSGVEAVVDNRPALMGRRSFTGERHPWPVTLPEPQPGVTEVTYADDEIRGRILLTDEVRSSSRPLLEKLYAAGLTLTMLSGDRRESAQLVAERVGLRDYEFGLSPQGKVERIQAWSAAGERPAMVGDGVNDAPSLAAAYVGVAMGMRGSDAALEQADVVLMKDRLDRFYLAYELSRRARRIIRQNLAISLGSVLVLVAAAFLGMIPLTIGVIGHEGSTVVVVLNSLRLLLTPLDEENLAGD